MWLEEYSQPINANSKGTGDIVRQYKLLYGYGNDTGLSALNGDIQEHINQGWFPAGPPVISGTGRGGSSSGDGGFLIIQPMATREEVIS
jgi:hypothetical protein